MVVAVGKEIHMDNTEATVELNWIEVTHPDNVTVTHTPALNDADQLYSSSGGTTL